MPPRPAHLVPIILRPRLRASDFKRAAVSSGSLMVNVVIAIAPNIAQVSLIGMPRVDNSQAIDAFKVFGVAGHEG